jgi:hypothetical protein
MLSYTPSRRRGSVLCASFLALSATTPAFAQLGQSDWVRPSDSGQQAQSNPQMGQSDWIRPGDSGQQAQPNTSGMNPGTGWMPANHSLPSGMQQQSPQMAPTQPAQQMQQMPQMDPGGPALSNDGSMPWQDAPRRRSAAQYTQAQPAPAADAAFQTPARGGQDAWSLPSAQQQMDLEWAKNMPNVPMSAVTPGGGQTAKPAARPVTAAAKPGVKSGTSGTKPATTTAKAPAKPAQGQLSGRVTQNANAPQPATQFDPNAGMPGPYGITAGMQQSGAVQPMNGGMQQMPMQQMQQQMPMQQMPMQQMGAAQPMNGGMQQMPMQQGGAMQPDMQQMNAVMQMNGMQPMSGGTQQMSTQQMPTQQMSAGNPMGGGMSPMGMGGMNPMQMLMGGGMAPGDTTPFDGIGRAIAGAASMGLIPTSNTQGVPNNPNNPNGGFSSQMGGPGATLVQQNGGGSSIPGAQLGRQLTRSVNNGINRNMGTMINLGLSRIHW